MNWTMSLSATATGILASLLRRGKTKKRREREEEWREEGEQDGGRKRERGGRDRETELLRCSVIDSTHMCTCTVDVKYSLHYASVVPYTCNYARS